MKAKKILKLSFFGLSGAGKGTACTLASLYIRQKEPFAEFFYADVASPLHKIQQFIYSQFGLKNSGQDGKLLQFLAKNYQNELQENISKRIDDFLKENEEAECPLYVLNSDCRNNAYNVLKDKGFIFIKIDTSLESLNIRREKRGDISLASLENQVEQICDIVPDYVVQNNSTIEDFEKEIQKTIELIC